MTDEKCKALLEEKRQQCKVLEKKLAITERLAAERSGQVRLLKKQIRALEEKQMRLVEAGNRLAEENEHLAEICKQQQELLEEMSAMLREITSEGSDDEQP